MECDLKYDYQEALRRTNLSQSAVDLLRGAAIKCESLPRPLTDKQVSKF